MADVEDWDKLGILGKSPPVAAPKWDKLGILSPDGPATARPKRTRSKRPRTAARDDDDSEQPSADEAPAPELAGLQDIVDSAKPELSRGPPPGPAGETRLQQGNQHAHAWYDEPLLKSMTSAVQGASGNLLDEATAGARWVGDKLGLSHSGNSYAENLALHKADLDRITRDYPYGHGAGQMATGMAAGAAAPGTKLAQGGVQGALSAASEYADSRDPLRTLGAGALGFASGVVGAAGGNWLAKKAATSEAAALERGLQAANRARPTGRAYPASGPDYTPVPEAPAPRPEVPRGASYDPLAAQTGAAIPEAPAPLPSPRGAPYDPLAAQTRPNLGGAPRPELIPAETAYAYDPLAGQTSPVVPKPAAQSAVSTALEGSDNLRDPAVRTALEMFTPTLETRSSAPELAEWAQKVVEHKLPPEAEQALLRAWSRRVQKTLPGVDPERLLMSGGDAEGEIIGELGPKYALGDFDAPKSALASPRAARVEPSPVPKYPEGSFDAPVAGPPSPRLGQPEPSPPFAVGDVDAPVAGLPRPRAARLEPQSAPPEYGPVGDLDVTPAPSLPPQPKASERELQQLALQQMADQVRPDKLSGYLRAGKTLSVLSGNPTAAGGLHALEMANRLRAPSLRDLAVQGGKLVPNENAALAGRLANEAGYEMSGSEDYLLDRAQHPSKLLRDAKGMLGAAPGFTSAAHAQDRQYRDEKVAYADQATVNYALTETLHGGNTGLSQADEQALTSAVVKGDDDAIRATDFRLRQRYPGYARRVERALRNLNEDD